MAQSFRMGGAKHPARQCDVTDRHVFGEASHSLAGRGICPPSAVGFFAVEQPLAWSYAEDLSPINDRAPVHRGCSILSPLKTSEAISP